MFRLISDCDAFGVVSDENQRLASIPSPRHIFLSESSNDKSSLIYILLL